MKKIVLVGFLLFAVFLAYYLCANRGLYVYLINNGKAPLKDVIINFTGGKKLINSIGATETCKVKINPISESSLSLIWKDSSGKEHSKKIDVYLEKGYRGTITITIDSRQTVSHSEDIKLW